MTDFDLGQVRVDMADELAGAANHWVAGLRLLGGEPKLGPFRERLIQQIAALFLEGEGKRCWISAAQRKQCITAAADSAGIAVSDNLPDECLLVEKGGVATSATAPKGDQDDPTVTYIYGPVLS